MTKKKTTAKKTLEAKIKELEQRVAMLESNKITIVPCYPPQQPNYPANPYPFNPPYWVTNSNN